MMRPRLPSQLHPVRSLRRHSISALLSGGVVAMLLAGCQAPAGPPASRPGGLPGGTAPGLPAPTGPEAPPPAVGEPAPAESGPGGPAGQPSIVEPPPAAGLPAAAPERTIELLATRQLRCADPGPQGQDPQQAFAEPFLDAIQWRAHLAAIDPGLRVALSSLDIDFSAGESAALVRPGALPNLGYRISIPQRQLPVYGRTLGVEVLVEPPPSQSLQAQVIAFPCVYLRLRGSGYEQVAVDVQRRPQP
jgi:hypothetical protein